MKCDQALDALDGQCNYRRAYYDKLIAMSVRECSKSHAYKDRAPSHPSSPNTLEESRLVFENIFGVIYQNKMTLPVLNPTSITII